jgi:uncharacterized Zn finger protein
MISQNDFEDTIISRGIQIFNDDDIKYLYLFNDDYYAKVRGEQRAFYNIKININTKRCNCNCKYYSNCKHLYATLLKIKSSDDIQDLSNTLTKMTKNNLIDIITKSIKTNPSILTMIQKNNNNNKIDKKYNDILTNIEDEIDNLNDDSEYEYDLDNFISFDEDLYKMLQIENNSNQIKFLKNKIKLFINKLKDLDLEFIFEMSSSILYNKK